MKKKTLKNTKKKKYEKYLNESLFIPYYEQVTEDILNLKLETYGGRVVPLRRIIERGF